MHMISHFEVCSLTTYHILLVEFSELIHSQARYGLQQQLAYLSPS